MHEQNEINFGFYCLIFHCNIFQQVGNILTDKSIKRANDSQILHFYSIQYSQCESLMDVQFFVGTLLGLCHFYFQKLQP